MSGVPSIDISSGGPTLQHHAMQHSLPVTYNNGAITQEHFLEETEFLSRDFPEQGYITDILAPNNHL